MNKENLANGLLASPVSTGATSATLQTGYGATMPAVPFKLTVTPFGQLSTRGNSEIWLVTALSGEVLTITRAQNGTSAKDFPAGSVVSNAVYVENFNPSVVVAEKYFKASNKTLPGTSQFVYEELFSSGERLSLDVKAGDVLKLYFGSGLFSLADGPERNMKVQSVSGPVYSSQPLFSYSRIPVTGYEEFTVPSDGTIVLSLFGTRDATGSWVVYSPWLKCEVTRK